jgi:CHAD domain-containing protein
MVSQKIHLAIQRHYRRVKTLGKTVAETWAEEDIHQFRVEVKKLRAFLRLAGSTHTGIKPRLPRRLHTFYSMVGIVRCLQLQRILPDEEELHALRKAMRGGAQKILSPPVISMQNLMSSMSIDCS